MKNSIKYVLFSYLIVLTVSAGLTGCGGSGDSGVEGSGQSLRETTVIFGNVADVITARAPAETEKSFIAFIKDFFTPILKAEAQGSEKEGILVTVEVNGEVIASDFTDSEGNFEFTLEIGGNVTLTFITDEFTTSIDIVVPEDGMVELVVTLEPDDVIVQQSETEFSGVITDINCPFIVVDGNFTVDTSTTEINDDETGSALACEELEVRTPVDVEGEIDLASGLVVAVSIEANSDDNADDDAVDEDEDGDDGSVDEDEDGDDDSVDEDEDGDDDSVDEDEDGDDDSVDEDEDGGDGEDDGEDGEGETDI